MKLKSLSIAAACAFAAAAAQAAPPASLAGTTWTLQINRESSTQLVILTQGAGAGGTEPCRTIQGTVGIAPMVGWYCPGSGQFFMRHNNIATGVTVRSFLGIVSDELIGQPLYMGGTAQINDKAFGLLGETNFSAVSQ
jgi:hypothetical protein